MPRPALAALLLGAALLGGAAQAHVPELGRARVVGSGEYRWFGLKIYAARLWLGEQGYQPGRAPLALELEYARNLDGRKIAEASRDEMRKLQRGSAAQHENWLAQMTRLFPDVREGTRITGVWLPGEGARFYLDGKTLGEIRDAEFADAFFAIWLAPQTSAPDLRRALLRDAGQP